MKFRLGVCAAVAAMAISYVCGVPSTFAQEQPAPPPAAAVEAPAAARGEAPAAPNEKPAALQGPPTPTPTRERSAAHSRAVGGSQEYEDIPAVATIVPTVFFATIFGLVVAGFYFSYRRDRHRHETLRALIERGEKLPPELLTPPKQPASDLRRGIVLLSAGIGVTILLASVVSEAGVWTAGLIPILMGAGYLLVWKLERPAAIRADSDAAHSYRG